MSDPNWRALVQGSLHRHRSDPGCRYLQLATVDPGGCPRNRTVVFRGFLDNSDKIQFAVDSRSEKLAQLKANPQAQVCWYFGKTREQYRISGSLLAIVDPAQSEGFDPAIQAQYQQDRQKLWFQMSERGRLLWYWPEPKGPQADPADFITQCPPDLDPPATFVMVLLDPVEVDHLQLKGDSVYPQLRQIFSRTGSGWQHRKVNP